MINKLRAKIPFNNMKKKLYDINGRKGVVFHAEDRTMDCLEMLAAKFISEEV